MSTPPKAHVYEQGVTHCAECGHHIEASWHYVKGADYHAEKTARLRADRILAVLRKWLHGNALLNQNHQDPMVFARGQAYGRTLFELARLSKKAKR